MTTKATKNAKGGGTIRKRSDGRWEARYTLGIDPKTGKQIQKSVYGKTQKGVRQKLTAITAEIDDGTYMDIPRLKTAESYGVPACLAAHCPAQDEYRALLVADTGKR